MFYLPGNEASVTINSKEELVLHITNDKIVGSK